MAEWQNHKLVNLHSFQTFNVIFEKTNHKYKLDVYVNIRLGTVKFFVGGVIIYSPLVNLNYIHECNGYSSQLNISSTQDITCTHSSL